MPTQAIDSRHFWPVDLAPRNGVLVLSGYGLDIRLWRGYLKVSDGIGKTRRDGIFHRATGRLDRLVVLGHTGSISLDAIRWLADVRAAYLQIDEDSRVLAAFGPRGTNRPSLIRAQAMAADTTAGMGVIRLLLRAKLARQRQVIGGQFTDAEDVADANSAISGAIARLDVAGTREQLRLAEAQGAAAYWEVWSPVEVRFAKRDEARAPQHWRTFGTRSSPLTNSPRLAVNPANAILNYLYAILEAEAAIAARIVGLDPGLGILHADQPNRDSLADDLMEPIRPEVDAYVHRLLSERRFALADFYETRQGACRITPALARELAETAQAWRPLVGSVAEDVARMLEAPQGERRSPTPLSGRNRSAGRGPTARPGTARRVVPSRACTWCGGAVTGGRSTCSAECAAQLAAVNKPAFVDAGVRALRALRDSGWRPELSDDGRRRITRQAADSVVAAREWQATHEWPEDMGEFTRAVLPNLVEVTAAELARRTGLSLGYCSRIKRGLVVPHPMWWEGFASPVGGSTAHVPAGPRRS